MSKPSRVYALVEDQRHKQLLYRFLVVCGFKAHEIEIELSPAGSGSAVQWVRENLVRQVGKCRQRNASSKTGMFVMLDADTRRVDDRLATLNTALEEAGQPPIDGARDPIARLIPKRNVETWILLLSAAPAESAPVDEIQDYKNTKTAEEWSAAVPAAARTLDAWTKRADPPCGLIDSLRRGIREIPRAIDRVG
ncbi:MAG: hypothetical protein WCE75_17420 [Terracidiphilus sp.]